VPVDSFVQLAPPDLSGLGLGTASFESMQALGFSADSSLLLVKISFTDDGEATPFSKYATFVYDLTEEKYIANLNELLGPEANVTQVKDAYIIGDSDSWEVVANVDVLDANSTTLKSYSSSGEITNNLVVAEATGLSHLTSSSEIEVESFQLTDDGRYLAVQTSSDLLAENASDDVNQSSDIYLIDRDTGAVTRVSFQGGIGKDDAVYLADIAKQGSQLQVAFVTDQYFSTKDQNSIDVDLNSSIESRNDLYLASADIGANGSLSEFTFELLSVDVDGFATGFVDKDSDSLPKITNRGLYFSSDSSDLVANDNNQSKDVFLSNSEGVQRIFIQSVSEISSGADFVGASDSGRVVFIKSSSQEFNGLPGVEQIIQIDTLESSYKVLSNNNTLADNTAITGEVSRSGGVLAFMSLASNLVTNDNTLGSEYDLYLATNKINEPPTALASSFLFFENSPLTYKLPTAIDEDGDTISFVLSDTSTSHGALNLSNDGFFTYAPDEGFVGEDAFTYKAFDGSEYSSEVQVSLQVRDQDQLTSPAFTSRYFVNGNGDDFIDFSSFGAINLSSQAVSFVGGNGIDSIFVSKSSDLMLDYSQAGLGIDVVYLDGDFSDFGFSYSGSNVILTRGGENSEVLKVSRFDKLIFKDGSISGADALTFAKSVALDGIDAQLPTLNSSETSSDFPLKIPEEFNNTIRAFVSSESDGEAMGITRPGVELIVVGGRNIDSVYVGLGGTVDATQLGLGQDKIFLSGKYSDYTVDRSSGSIVTLSRDIDGFGESIRFNSGTSMAFDEVFFSDGLTSTYDIKKDIVALDLTQSTPIIFPEAFLIAE